MSRRLRPWAAGAVIALHLPLLMRPEPPAARDAPLPGRPPLWLHLPAAPAPADAPAAAPSAQRPANRTPAPAAPAPAAGEPVTQAITLPPSASAAPASAAAPAPARPDSPLDLSLPPVARRGDKLPLPAPRPRSVESGIARALEDGPLIEQGLGNGRIRLRQGGRCVELRDAHMARIDPFNQSVNPIPKQGEDCSR